MHRLLRGKACFALRRLTSTVPADSVRTCYFATVHSLLQYGVGLWARAADWERVFRMQKRAVRIIARVSQDASARPHFVKQRIITLPGMLVMQVALYARERLQQYPRRGDRHAYATRGAQKLATVARNLTKTAKSIHVMGPEVYNKLPEDITSASNFVKILLFWRNAC